jgi:perosamine synthetase
MYGITIDEEKFGLNRHILQKELEKYGIETRSFFFPLNLQPAYMKYDWQFSDCPVAEKLWNTGFYLPSSSQLAVEDIHYICNTIKNIKTNAKKIKKKYELLK